ncbi:MAG: hypothetical protein JWQ43_1460 [Glaciihabitans sp.]|nr:hypothetical protein [Glaciihabitans sp.]
MADENTAAEKAAELDERLHGIEAQPLDTRASAYAQVHDQLQAQLEGGDTVRTHG